MQETYIFIYEKPPKIMKIKQDIEAEMNPRHINIGGTD